MSGRDDDDHTRLSGEAARRQILARRARFVALALGTSGIAACESPKPCLDVAAVVPSVCLNSGVSPSAEVEDAGAPDASDAGNAADADAGDADAVDADAADADAGDADARRVPDAGTPQPCLSKPTPCLGPRPCLKPPPPPPRICLDF